MSGKWEQVTPKGLSFSAFSFFRYTLDMNHFLIGFLSSFFTGAIVALLVRITVKRKIGLEKEKLRLAQENNDLLKQILARLSS